MEIKFLGRLESDGDFTTLRYQIHKKPVDVEVGGTAMSVYDCQNLSTDDLGDIFIPLLWDVNGELSEQGALLEKIKLDSDGLKDWRGKIIYSRDQVKGILETAKQGKQDDQAP